MTSNNSQEQKKKQLSNTVKGNSVSQPPRPFKPMATLYNAVTSPIKAIKRVLSRETIATEQQTSEQSYEAKAAEVQPPKKSNRGGARQGAGRKKKEVICQPELPSFIPKDKRGGKRENAGRKPNFIPQVFQAKPTTSQLKDIKQTAASQENDQAALNSRFGQTLQSLVQENVDDGMIPAKTVMATSKTLTDKVTFDSNLSKLTFGQQYIEHVGDSTPVEEPEEFKAVPLGVSSLDSQSSESLNQLVEVDEDIPYVSESENSVVYQYLKQVETNIKDKNSSIFKSLQDGYLWINPPQPSIQLARSVLKGQIVKPDCFYYPKVYAFLPAVTYPHLVIKCPVCKSKTSPKGYPERMRRVIGLDQTYYLATNRYLCLSKDCGCHFVATRPDVLSQLPYEVQFEFPCFLTKRSALDNTIVKMLSIGVDNSVSPAGMAHQLKELHTQRHQELELQYYSTIRSLQARQQQQLSFGEKKIQPKSVKLFSTFGDSCGYAGFTPSAGFLLHVFNLDVKRVRSYLDLEVQRRGGQFMKIDHSHKLTKHLQQINGVQIIVGLASVMNEFEEVRSQLFVQSTADRFLEQSLKDLRSTAIILNQPLPKHVWVDRCCDQRQFLENVWPEIRQGVSLLSVLPLPSSDKIYYITDATMANLTLTAIMRNYFSISHQVPVGFDCEWDVNSEGKASKVALVQVAFDDGPIVLFHLSSMSSVPQLLKEFLSNQKFLKVGRNIGNDAALIKLDYAIDVSPLLELGQWAKRHGLAKDARVGLKALVESVLSYQLPKDANGPRLSMWTRKSLTQEQKDYAARDALASLKVYTDAKITESDMQSHLEDSLSPCSSSESVSQHVQCLPPGVEKAMTGVQLDHYHAMARIQVPVKHAFCAEFSRCFRDAMFEINIEDQKAIEAVMGDDAVMKDMTFLDLLRLKPDWVLRRTRRRVPPPHILEENLKLLIEEFRQAKYKDPKTQRLLLDDAALKQFANLMKHVRNGCLSDPPNMQLYYEKGVDHTGLKLYRCIRGTSDLEGGIHQKLVRKLKTWNAGPELADNCLAVIRHRYNVRASVRHRPQFPNVGHYAHHIIDLVQAVTFDLLGKSVHEWWLPLTKYQLTSECFGVVPCVDPSEYEQVTQVDVQSYTPSIQYLALKMRQKIPHLPMIMPEERQLFSQSLYKYLPKTGGIEQIDFEQMADDWNNNRLNTKPDGVKIFKKLEYHLSSFVPKYLKIVTKGSVLRSSRDSLKLLIQSFNDGHAQNQSELMKAAVAHDIYHPLDQAEKESSVSQASISDSDEFDTEQDAGRQQTFTSGATPLPEVAFSLASQPMKLINAISVGLLEASSTLPAIQEKIVDPSVVSGRQNPTCKKCGKKLLDLDGCKGGTARGQCNIDKLNGVPKKIIKSKKNNQSDQN